MRADISLDNRVDVLIVGGSHAGLAAATQIARARRSVLVIDAGRPRNRFAIASHGFLTQDGLAPAVILGTAREQLLSYPTARFRSGSIRTVERLEDHFQGVTEEGESIQARRVIVATGVEDILPAVPGLPELWGDRVLHCAYCHGFEVAGRPLGALWGGQSSLDQAKLLTDWGTVTLLAPPGTFSDDQSKDIRARGITVETRPPLSVEATELGCRLLLAGGAALDLAALFVVPQIRQACGVAEALGCEVEAGPSGPCIRTDARKQTSVVGVYAAGDAAQTMRNAMFAAADGVMAGISAHQSLIAGARPCAATKTG